MSLLRVLSAAVVVGALWPGIARATPFDEADAAYGSGDYVTAFERLSSLALQGNAEAEYKLGCLYQNGDGISRNLTEAVTWFVVAADHGVTAAAATLGILYSVGLGVPVDAQSSADWFRRAAAPQTDTVLVLPSDVPQN